jgi:hypothetical protein
MKVKVWKIIGLILIAFFALSAPNTTATPTMSSMAGTYVEQTSSGTGYNIILYENGTALFSTYAGTWSIVNSTTFEGTYTILISPRTDYFTITNNGFTAVQTGNTYVKTASASSNPTASATATPTTSAPSPTVPEFSSVALILVAAAIAVVTLGTVALTKRTRKQLRK